MPPEAILKGEWERKSLPTQQDKARSLLTTNGWDRRQLNFLSLILPGWEWPGASLTGDPCRFAHLAALHESVNWQENHRRLFTSRSSTSLQIAVKDEVFSPSPV